MDIKPNDIFTVASHTPDIKNAKAKMGLNNTLTANLIYHLLKL